jgi:hypothetical protein
MVTSKITDQSKFLRGIKSGGEVLQMNGIKLRLTVGVRSIGVTKTPHLMVMNLIH